MAKKTEESGKFRKKKVYFSQVSNVALRDSRLSLKAKGLYSLIESYISLENYVLYKSTLYNNCIEKDKAFDGAWNELKNAGYLKQYRIRSAETNKYTYEYELLEEPDMEQPALLNIGINGQVIPNANVEQGTIPSEEENEEEKLNPPHFVGGSKSTGFNSYPVQNGGNNNNTDLNNTNIKNTDLSIYQRTAATKTTVNSEEDRKIDGLSKSYAISENEREKYRIMFSENIDYYILKEKYHVSGSEQVDEILDVLVETASSKKESHRINGEEIPASIVISKLLKLNQGHIEYVMECLSQNTKKIKNIKSYMLTALYNAPSSISTYYQNQVNHDLYDGER